MKVMNSMNIEETLINTESGSEWAIVVSASTFNGIIQGIAIFDSTIGISIERVEILLK